MVTPENEAQSVVESVIKALKDAPADLEKALQHAQKDGVDPNFLKMMATATSEARAQALADAYVYATQNNKTAEYELMKLWVNLITEFYQDITALFMWVGALPTSESED